MEGWLLRMVQNACFHMRRGRKNDPALHTTEAPLLASEASPELASARSEAGERLQAALLSLGPEDRAILMLAEGEGWTGPEIGARMGLSAGAVRTRLTRTRQRLRGLLEAGEGLGE